MPHDAARRVEGPTQGTQTGDPHRGEGPTEDPPPEGRATQGTHTGHTQTRPHSEKSLDTVCEGTWCRDNAPGQVFDEARHILLLATYTTTTTTTTTTTLYYLLYTIDNLKNR